MMLFIEGALRAVQSFSHRLVFFSILVFLGIPLLVSQISLRVVRMVLPRRPDIKETAPAPQASAPVNCYSRIDAPI